MIYFNQSLQRQVMLTFHYALETAATCCWACRKDCATTATCSNTVDRKHKIY